MGDKAKGDDRDVFDKALDVAVPVGGALLAGRAGYRIAKRFARNTQGGVLDRLGGAERYDHSAGWMARRPSSLDPSDQVRGVRAQLSGKGRSIRDGDGFRQQTKAELENDLKVWKRVRNRERLLKASGLVGGSTAGGAAGSEVVVRRKKK